MVPIDLKTAPAYWRRIALLWGMFGFFGLVIAAMAASPALGIFGLLLMLAPAWLLLRRRLTWAARMDGDGVTLRNGKRLAWSELEKVVDIQATRGGARWHNHYELIFRSGRACVFDRMLANANEVVAAVTVLARGENPFPRVLGAR
jgi:hypothetical protein